ncbi:response regulator [Paenibacillus macerans]|uniref:response regulator transcription factor n=1 Tax=Paenibacillus macerans TaxID=44252 RepID=UPI00203CAE54|nr:response regulator [Paenibacillus macerans]MCM3698325.1 response regulator [Paenibacillus macerans]
MRLKALLVDDEIHILSNLSKILPWGDMGFEIVGLARNGKDALEAAAMHRPDLILSDIRMPVMDGITLLQKVRELNFPCEILLLTGYQEFEYAKTAIRYGVKDYICKPIHYAELEETVGRLAGEIREKRKTLGMEKRLDQAKDLAAENFLLHSLLGQETENGVLWDDEEGSAEERRYAVLLVDFEGYSHHSLPWSAHERKAWNLQTKHAIQEIFGGVFPAGATVLQIREGEWCLVAPGKPDSPPITKQALLPGIERLRQRLREEGEDGLAVRFCLELRPQAAQELAAAYYRLQQMLILNGPEEWFLEAGEGRTEDFREIWPAEDSRMHWRWIEQLGGGLRNGNPEALEQAVAELKQYIGYMDEHRAYAAVKLLHYLLIHLLREMRELQMLPGEQEEALWHRLQRSLSLKDLLSLIVSLIGQSKSRLSSKKTSELLMMTAENYIQQHLGDDFGIEELADHLGISTSYFCLLFKNHFGETFVEYLTKQRIELAKCLLRESGRSIAQIGSEIGYQERRYFTKVFQKHTGMTPSDYRLKETDAS